MFARVNSTDNEFDRDHKKKLEILKRATIHSRALKIIVDGGYMDYYTACDAREILPRFSEQIDHMFLNRTDQLLIHAYFDFETNIWSASLAAIGHTPSCDRKLADIEVWLNNYGGGPYVASYIKELGCLDNENWAHELERARGDYVDMLSDNTSLATFGTTHTGHYHPQAFHPRPGMVIIAEDPTAHGSTAQDTSQAASQEINAQDPKDTAAQQVQQTTIQ